MEDSRDDFDLAQFDEEFAEAPVEDKNSPVPDGKYQVTVEKVELTTAKTSGNRMLKWTLRILAPSSIGRYLWRNSVITRDGVRWLKHDLHLCGVNIEKLSDLPANLERLLDVKLEVAKRTRGDSESVFFNRRIVTETAPAAARPDDDIPF
jgi:hypothetical protein